MASATAAHHWDAAHAASLDELGLLVYASNLLGSDPTVTNFGGGNTSVKSTETDPLTGEPTEVLWVKGSGGDLGSATSSSFAALEMSKLKALRDRVERDAMHEDDVVPLYARCAFGGNSVPCSIDTPLHAFVEARAVSHMHSDAVIAIAAAADSERLCDEVWEGQLAFLPWKRPGFELGLQLARLQREAPGATGALMAQHGFICWADDWEECYRLTLRIIERAQQFIERNGRPSPLGSARPRPAAPDWGSLLPRLRGLCAWQGRRVVTHVDGSEEALAFLDSEKAPELARLGTSCPDHFLRTKIRPLWLDARPLEEQVAGFAAEYQAYYDRCRRPDSPPVRNPNPSVVLVPGGGVVGLAKDPREARITTEFFGNAMRVMRGSEAVSRYIALAEQEAFDIEYWALEEAKLRRQPPERELSRTIALVTGAAQGIGRATAQKLASLGACVAMVDLDADRLAEARAEAGAGEALLAVVADVTDADALRNAFDQTVRTFGGLDVAVVNAGTARRGAAAETEPGDYDLQERLLMRAYRETSAHALDLMTRQGTGGSIVFVASKNGVAVGSRAAIYSAAKAFELHLMRSIAVDYAPHGIRANAVNPDAVLSGSGIWSAEWRAQTAASLGIPEEGLEAHYRDRSLLRREVLPEHVAEAVAWLASEARCSRTTGCVIPVDGGNREGFLR